MSKQLQLRRGTTTEHTSFVGAPGEVTVDTDKNVAVVHDGVTAGGFPLQTAVGLQGAIGNLSAPLLDLPLKNSLAMKAGVGAVTFTRSTTATYIDRYGVLKYASNDEPRFEKEGLLIEGSSTNLLTYSEQFDNSAWTKTVTVTPNDTTVSAPDGSFTAYLIEDTATDDNQYMYQDTSVSDDTISRTASIFLKAGTSNIVRLRLQYWGGDTNIGHLYVDLLNGDFVVDSLSPDSFKIEYVRDGWYRIGLTKDDDGTGHSLISFTIHPAQNTVLTNTSSSTATGSVYVWGAQLEELPFATSYIPTVDSSVTRASDNCSVDYVGNVPDVQEEISVVLDWDTYGDAGDTCKGLLGTNLDWKFISYGWGNDLYVFGTFLEYTSGYLVGRLLLSLKQNNLAVYNNGNLVNSFNNVGATSSQASTFNIGSYNGVHYLFGHLSNIKVYDRALSPTEAKLA